MHGVFWIVNTILTIFTKSLVLSSCRQCKPVRSVCHTRSFEARLTAKGELSRRGRLQPGIKSIQRQPTTAQEGAIGKVRPTWSAAGRPRRTKPSRHRLLRAVVVGPLVGKACAENSVASLRAVASRRNTIEDAWSCHPDGHTKFQGQSLAQRTSMG